MYEIVDAGRQGEFLIFLWQESICELVVRELRKKLDRGHRFGGKDGRGLFAFVGLFCYSFHGANIIYFLDKTTDFKSHNNSTLIFMRTAATDQEPPLVQAFSQDFSANIVESRFLSKVSLAPEVLV